jgi:hypothetical protein
MSLGLTQNDGFIMYGAYSDVQNSPNSGNAQQMIQLADYLIGIANSFAFGLIPTASDFYSPSGEVQIEQTSVSFSTQGTSTVAYSFGTGYLLYTPILASNGTASQLFGIKIPTVDISNPNGGYLALIEYQSTVTFVSGYSVDDNSYATSGSLITGVYVHNSG